VVACARVVESFLNYGSHFATLADWGCQDGEHKAWIVIEAENKAEARGILPPAFQSQAKIVQLNKFTMEDIAEILEGHRH
jgi:nicotinate-nucleotide pyrophosphorylase